MLNKFEQWKLSQYKAQIGAMSSTEALTLALKAEEIRKDLGAFDLAFEYYSNKQYAFEGYALLLEKNGE